MGTARASLAVDVADLAAKNFPEGSYLKRATGDWEYILDEYQHTLLLFAGDGSGVFDRIYSPLNRRSLRMEILALPSALQTRLAELLGLPAATPEDIEAFKRVSAQREADRVLLGKAMLLAPGFKADQRFSVEQNLIRGIIQKEYAITNAASKTPLIATFGLGPCIALVVYDPETTTTALAHIDGTTKIESLGAIFDDFNITPEDFTRLRVGLIGGDGSSRKIAINMIRYLQSKGVPISYADILSKPHPINFAVDSRSGEIIPGVRSVNNGEDLDSRMQISGLQTNAFIKKEFDGRTS